MALVQPCTAVNCPATCAEIARLSRFQEDAKLADAAYKPMGQRHVPGFTEITDEAELNQLGVSRSMLEPTDSQFRAAVLRNDRTGEIVTSFKGTTFTSVNDWTENARQGLGMESDYYTRAQEIARHVSEDAPDGTPVRFVGHSLGGGMASAAARATGRAATTFNAAGLHNNTVPVPANPQPAIDAVNIRGEILTTLQSITPGLPEAIGTPYALDPSPTVASALSRVEFSGLDAAMAVLNPKGTAVKMGLRVARAIAARATELHSMQQVEKSLQEKSAALQGVADANGCQC